MIGFHRSASLLTLACLTVTPGIALSRESASDRVSGSTLEVTAPPGRELTLDDVLSMETFGAALLSPDGAWIAFERRRPYDTAARFDRAHRSGWTVSDLMLSRTDSQATPRLLIPREPETGILFGSWSPDSRRMLVYRLKGEQLEAGIVTVANGSVHWTGLTPDLPITGVASAWLDDHLLAITVHPEGDLPWMLRFDTTGKAEMDRRWQDTIEGRTPSRSRIETRNTRVTVDAEKPPLQLVILNVLTGEQRIMASGDIRDFAASPQGERLAVVTSAERAPSDPSGVIVQSAVQTRSRLTLVDVASGLTTKPAEPLDVAPNLLRWSPAGDAVLVWSRQDEQPWRDAGLTAIGLGGGIRRFEKGNLLPLPERANIDELRAVQADWAGEGVVLRARQPGSARFDWWRIGTGEPAVLTAAMTNPPAQLAASSGDVVLAFADGRLWALGGDRGAVAVSPSSGPRYADGQTHTLMEATRSRINESPRRDWVVARSGVATLILDGGHPTIRAEGPECAGTFQVRSAVPAGVATVCLDQGVETLRLATGRSDRMLSQVNPGFAGIAMPRAQPIVHRDRLGRETTSYLYMPPGLEPDQVKGLLVHVYPGGADDGRYVDATNLSMGPREQILASAGYAVLSAAFTSEEESLRAEMIDDFVRGTDLAVDAALAAFPGLPEDRMAMIGHSFGGYTALSVATRSQRYRTYISWAGPTDEVSNWGDFIPHSMTWPADAPLLDIRIGATEVGQANMGGPPWANIDAYAAASPYLMADRINAPILLITADRDYVPMGQAQRMLTAMHRQGKWARLVTYWGETHTNASPANIRDVYSEIFDWLDRTLGPEAAMPRTGDAPMPEPSPRSPLSP